MNKSGIFFDSVLEIIKIHIFENYDSKICKIANSIAKNVLRILSHVYKKMSTEKNLWTEICINFQILNQKHTLSIKAEKS